ncbi:enolase-phosphatase E1-like [Enoplosus armatus]|uniref:enolase-phosphatase E1-like n=1 Tax=Enoplosus armatus TaxID=215367 RepID=UPI003993D682
MTAPTPKRKYTRHSQKICEEFQKEVDEVAEENELPTTKVVEELAVTEGEEPQEITSINEDVVSVDGLREKKQLEDEQLSNEEETEKQVGSGVEDTVVKGSSTEPPDTAETALTKEIEDEKVPDESEKDQKGVKVETSVIQDKQEVSDDGIEEPPVVQKRALTDRCEVTPKPKSTKQSKRHQKQDEEHTDEADLEAGGSAEKADEQAMDKQMEEHHQVEQEDTVDKTEEEITVVEDGTIPKAAKAAEDVIPSSGMNMEESKEVQEEEETGGETEIVSVMEADKEEVAGDMIQEPDTVAAASETITPDEVLDEATAPVAEEPQEKDTGCEIPKLQKAAVILVDLKTTCHHLSIKEAEGTPVDGECAAPEKVKMELIAAEEKEVPSCVAEEQTPEPEMLVLEEEGGGKQENSTEISVNATAEAETVEKEELREDYSDKEKEESANVNEGKSEAEEAPVIETRVLRGGRKTVEASCKSISRSNQQQEEDNIGEDITEKRVDEAETGTEMEREMEAMAKDDITVTAPVEEKQSVSVSAHISETADIPVVDYVEENPPLAGVEEALCLEEEESPVVATRALRSETKTATPRHKTTSSRKQSDEQEAGNSEKEKTAVTTRTLRFGRISASATHMRKSRRICEQIQGEEQKGEEESKSVDETGVEEEQAVKKAAVEKTDEEIEETNEEEIGEKVQSLCRDRLLQFVTVEVEKVVSEGTMSMTEEEENTDGVTPAADNLEVQQGETDIPLPKPTTDSAILSEEDATPSAEEQQSGDQKDGVPFPQRVTVVLVDLKKTHHDIQEETAAIKEGVPVEKTAAEAEEEQREETMPEKHVPSSSVRIEKTELEKVVVVEEGFEEKVEDAITIQDTVEGIAQETAEEDVAKSVDDESTSTSEVIETVAGESAQEALLTAKDDEGKGASEEKEAPVIETRRLRSGEKTMRATTRSKTTKRQHDKQEEEAIREKSTEGEPAVEKRVLRKGRCTVTHKSKRIRTQCQTEEEGEDKTTPAEEIQVEETKVVLEEAEREEDSINEKIEENNEEEAAAQKEDKTEQEVEMEKVEVVAEESLKEQETVEEEQLAVLETCTDRQAEASVRESAEETPTTDEGKVPGVEEAPTVETRVLRSGGKAIKATPRSKNTKTVVEKRADKDEPTVGAGVLRKGRSAPATPRRKSKRACTQCQLEEEREEETTPAEETEGEEEEAGQDWPEEKCEKAEEEGKSMEMEVKKGKDVEEEEIESAVGGESAVGDAKPIQVASTEEAVVLEKEDNNLNLVTAVDETGTDTVEILSAEAEETNSAEEEETTVIEKSTAATEVGSDTTIAEKEVLVALVEDASVVAKEEAPATRTLRKSKTSHVTPSQRSRRQKDQGVVETQLQDEETQEVHQLTDDSSEKRELYAKEQAETEERSNFGQGTGPPAEDAAEEQNKETADLIDNRVVEPAGEEPAIEEMELPEEELSDGKDTSSVVEGRSLRRRMKTDADKEEDKAGEIQLPKRRSIRKRPRVDYRENDDDEEENEEGETEAATDKEEEAEVGSDEDKDNKKAECSANELIEKREESSREENLENDKGAIESTSEKGGILNLVLDPDEEVETAGISQDDKEYEQNVSEEEVEPIVIGTRVLRGRSVPSITITPQSKSRCCSAKVQKAEESDEERSPQSSQKRNLRKRKSTEVTPTRKSKRHSRV